jgi:putative SOS response-associated peptidase YedK
MTTEANEITSAIHTRMPVIIHKRDWAEWLDRDSDGPAPVHLLRPYASDEMRTDCSNPALGNVRNNGLRCSIASDRSSNRSAIIAGVVPATSGFGNFEVPTRLV